MKLRVTAALCVLVLLAADNPAEKKADELEGVWMITAMVQDGSEETKPPAEAKITFKAGKATNQFGEETREATYLSDATKKPATLDITPSDGPDKGKTRKLIYRIEGDKLTLCGARDPEDPRPTEFSAKKGEKQLLLMLKREKK
jgi:uncharacterized protein (TIGR03067 family)